MAVAVTVASTGSKTRQRTGRNLLTEPPGGHRAVLKCRSGYPTPEAASGVYAGPADSLG
jgi:hypothetical protein